MGRPVDAEADAPRALALARSGHLAARHRASGRAGGEPPFVGWRVGLSLAFFDPVSKGPFQAARRSQAMHPSRQAHLTAVGIAALALASAPGIAGERRSLPSIVAFPNASGVAATTRRRVRSTSRIRSSRCLAPTTARVRPAMCRMTAGRSRRRASRRASQPRPAPIRSSAPTMARSPRMPTYRRSRHASSPTTCCSPGA